MNRLQKVAVFNITMMLVATGLVITIFILTGSSGALLGMFVLVALHLNRWLFKGKGQPDWDEREKGIGRRATFIGFLVFWTVFFMSAWLYATVIGRHVALPLWAFAFVPVAGAYVLIMSSSLVALWLAREPGSRRTALFGLILLTVLLIVPLVVGTDVLFAKASERAFAGSYQADEWHVTRDEQIIAHSRINLTRWPNDSRIIPITLPYENAKVQSAAFAGEAVEVRNPGQGKYEVELPENFVWPPSDMTVEVVWTVPLSTLESDMHFESSPYRARLRSLIPTSSFSLKVVLERKAGFEFFNKIDKNWMYPFRSMRGDGIYRTNHGECSMCILRTNR